MKKASTAQDLDIHNSHDNSAGDNSQYFTFLLHGQEYGVDILRIQEVRGWSGVRGIPNMPHYVKGVIDLRGVVVPIIDLAERFGLPSVQTSALSVVIVLRVIKESKEQIMGLLVDAVSEVFDIAHSDLKASPEFQHNRGQDYVKALATVNEKMIVILDVDELLGNLPDHVPPIRQNNTSSVAQGHSDEGGSWESVEDNSIQTPGSDDKKDTISLVEESFELLYPKLDNIVESFYQKLFLLHPETKSFFADSNLNRQHKKLVSALRTVVNKLRRPQELSELLGTLGKKHQKIGAMAEHYDIVSEVLIDVLAEYAGSDWNREYKQAWKQAMGLVKKAMLDAYVDKSGPFSQDQIEHLETSFALLKPRINELVAKFYGQLFRQYPDVKPLFAKADPQEQKRKLVSALTVVVENLRTPDKLVPVLKKLGFKHQRYGAVETHYDVVAGLLLELMEQMAEDDWTAEIEMSWRHALGVVKEIMLSGYE